MNMSPETLYRGQWLGDWETTLKPWLGPDFSRRCFLFVGQGSVKPGMFSDLYAAGGPLRQRFDQADQWALVTGLRPVSTFVTAPESLQGEELVWQRNLALCTAEVGLFDAVIAAGVQPRLLTGFSLGEFPALCCAGVLEFVDMLRLVLARDRACDSANSLGYLVAVSAAPQELTRILGNLPYQVSNRNSPLQTAISVAPLDLDRAADRLRRANRRYRVLENVPQPYHSTWMQPAADCYRQWLADNPPFFGPVSIPVLSSVTNRLLEPGRQDPVLLLDMLGRQLVAPVNFIAQIEAAREERCYAFLEIGPGTTLTGFTSEILGDREHCTLNLADLLGTDGAASAAIEPVGPEVINSPFARRLLDRVRQAIARATGYDIVSITVEDRFQEDLGIDSIKKADILFSVVKDDPDLTIHYDASAVRRIADVVAALTPAGDETVDAPPRRRKANFQRFVLDWQPGSLTRLSGLRKAAGSSRMVRVEELFVEPATGVAHLTDLDRIVLRADGEVPSLIALDAVAALAKLAAFLEGWRVFAGEGQTAGGDNMDARDVELCLVTDAQTHPMLLGLPAFFRSLGKENANLFPRHLHFDRIPGDAVLVEQIEAEFAGSDDVGVSFINGQRYRPTLVPASEARLLSASGGEQIVVAIGGAGGILREILGRLANASSTRLIVVGRKDFSRVTDSLAGLRASFREVDYRRLDATDVEAMRSLVGSVVNRFGRIDLVLNAAGEERSALLASKSGSDIEEELAAKVLPVANLFTALAGDTGTRVVCFSSIVAHWGNPGQTVYACGNGIIEAITAERNRQSGQKLAVAIQWPPWNAVGMTAQASVRSRLERAGLALLDPDPAMKLLASELNGPADDVVHYGDDNDRAFYEIGLADHRAVRPVLGIPSTSGGYRRTLHSDTDPWLRDHAVDGTSVLPAATMMTMALCAARRANPAIRSLKDFRIHRPLQLRGEPVDLHTEVAGQPDGVRVYLRSRTLHAECLGTPVCAGKQALVPTIHYPDHRLKARPVYHQAALFHGPSFQVLHGLDFISDDFELVGSRVEDSELVLAKIETDRLSRLDGILPWDRLTLWVDGGFQALALLALHRYRVLALPVSVSGTRYRLDYTETSRVRVIARETDRLEGRFRGEIFLLGDDGSELIRMEGVELAEIRSTERGHGQ